MPAPFPPPRQGVPVNNPPIGFPAFFDKRQPRVLTADPWAFLQDLVAARVDGRQRETGYSYINQAWGLFEAASNPHVGSRPLLYYYSFLNLVKAALLIRRAPLAMKPVHGISDPGSNQRQRLRLGGQTVRIQGLAHDHSRLFAEFVRTLGGKPTQREVPVMELLAQIPSIHRTFMRVTRRRRPLFTPIKEVKVLRTGGQMWTRVILQRDDGDVRTTFPALKGRRGFRRRFQQTSTAEPNEIWLETASVPGRKRGIDRAIQKLAKPFQDTGVSTVLTRDGHRMYFCNIAPRHQLPRLAATYAAFFYLGSISRYKPDALDSILSSGFSWVVHELIATEPVQFVYTLASELAGVEVVRPYATA
jgi:YaaC-like Protein